MSHTYAEALSHLAHLGPELAPSTPGAPARKFDLAHMRALMSALGNPQDTVPSILIAGTNGKGSTAATLASILASAGHRTALYTSPHLVRVNERMQLSSPSIPTEYASVDDPATLGPVELHPIPDDDLARLYFRVDDTATDLVAQNTLPHTPSFFERLTAVAFLWFAERHADIAVLEVGLGGRLDATNIVTPLLSVITDIALDHQDYLGSTLAEITREKAGILRPTGTLITLPQHGEVNQTLGEIAATMPDLQAISAAPFIPPAVRNNEPRPTRSPRPEPQTQWRDPLLSPPREPSSRLEPPPKSLSPRPEPQAQWRDPLLSPPREPSSRPEAERSEAAAERPPHFGNVPSSILSSSEPQHSASVADLSSPLTPNHYHINFEDGLLEVDSPLPGHHQQRNLALAIAAAQQLRNNHSYRIANTAMEAGIRNTHWPGRLEFVTLSDHHQLLLDVAHNPAGAWTLRAAIAQLPPTQPRTLVFSCLRDKDLAEMAQILFPLFDSSSTDPERRHDHIVLAPIENPRAAHVDDLLAQVHRLDIPAHAAPHLHAALTQAQAITPPGGLILATGSVYLVGELRHLLVPHA